MTTKNDFKKYAQEDYKIVEKFTRRKKKDKKKKHKDKRQKPEWKKFDRSAY